MADPVTGAGASVISAYTQAINQAVQTGFSIYDEWKARQVHPLADQWVGSVQDPFGAQLAIIVDLKDAGLRDGTATADDVYFAQNAVIRLWQGYQDVAAQFAALGPDYAKVIEQSYKTLTPIINQILNDMSAQIAQLGGISVSARLGVNTSHYGMLVVIGLFILIAFILVRRAG
jgi:hypothetical protein